MKKDDMQNIINSIKKESLNFFANDMKFDILEVVDIPNYLIAGHFSAIELNHHIKLIVSLDIEDKLFDILFDKFFKDGVSEDEKSELIEALPDEIINTVVGLAIRNFPDEYKVFILGIPLQLTHNDIFSILEKNQSLSCKITTTVGSLICTVIYKKN